MTPASNVYECWAQDMRGGPLRAALASRAVIRRDSLRWASIPSRKPGARYRLSNGRLPEFQPIVTEAEARAWLADNPSATAFRVSE